MQKVESLFISAIRSELCGEKYEAENEISNETLVKLYKLSDSHDMAHIVAEALYKSCVCEKENELFAHFQNKARLAVYRYQLLAQEQTVLFSLLENLKVEYLPLKGAVIRNLYPIPWMRTSCDIDVLVHEQDLDKILEELKKNKYQIGERSSHDVSATSPRGVHVEVHFLLIEQTRFEKANQVLENIWNLVEPSADSNYKKRMPDDVFYLYHVVHAAKHFYNGGCGVKVIMDTWILNHKVSFDRENREKLLKQCGLFKFEQGISQLAEVWFSQQQPNQTTKLLGDYIFSGGTYGTLDNIVKARKVKKGRCAYIWSRIFQPYDTLKFRYPILQKKKWLMPIYQIKRWIDLLKSGHGKNARAELRISYESKNTEDIMGYLIKELGL